MAEVSSRKKVLLVDDDHDILAAMQAALGDLNLEIRAVSDGNSAIEQNQTFTPDIVVLDMMLPKRSGFLVLESLKKGKKRTDAPRVIMVTGNLGSRHKTYAESLGVDGYINKPFRMEKLIDMVKKIIS